MLNRLVLSDYKIKKTLIQIKIFQDLLLSSILYLFYTVELLKICNNAEKKLNVSRFINNIKFKIFIYLYSVKAE